MKERPILVAVIGYIIGILWGLYFKFSIVLFNIIIIATYFIFLKCFKNRQKNKFKLLSIRRYSRYLKLYINKKVIFIIMIFSVLGNGIVNYQQQKYENTYQDRENLELVGIIVSSKIEKEYYNLYQIKVLNSKTYNLYIQVSKDKNELDYGDKVKLQGEYNKPSKRRNYGGYDDSQYLKTLKIAGRIKVNKIEIIDKKQINKVLICINNIKLEINKKIEENMKPEKAVILKGLLLGETQDISNETKEKFQISNISHVLAISGMHISYIILGVEILFKKSIGKRKTRVIIIIVLLFYTLLTGFSPSIVRASLMSIIVIGSKIIYRKSDIANSIALPLFITLLYNPFLILHVGLQLSYLGTIGIILFREVMLKIIEKFRLNKKMAEILSVTLSAQIMIIPVICFHFNSLGIYFLITNLLVSIIIGPIIILGFLYILLLFVCYPIATLLSSIIEIGIELLNIISKFSELPFAKIYIPTFSVLIIILYWIFILIIKQIYLIYQKKQLTPTEKRVKNLIALFCYKFNNQKKKYIKFIFLIVSILIILHFSLPQKLNIHFVDVGQGDCTFITTPKNKTILIDGGGSTTSDFDVGKKTLIPYLLDRGYATIDYVIISHFDQDHVRWHYCNP